jgi:hypothetical protein
MSNQLLPPFPNTYWVVSGCILAGEYPTLLDPATNRERVQQLLHAGITVFLDLTETDEVTDLEPYLPLAQALIGPPALHLEYSRIPIPDMQIPPISTMQHALDTIDSALARQRAIYIHCWGGIGRTGTVIGCYLVRHGMTGEAAIQEIARLRQHTPDYRYPAPARDIQRQMVYTWQPGT